MRYLVTGATGGLGRSLFPPLIAAGGLMSWIERSECDFRVPDEVTKAAQRAVRAPFPDAPGDVPLFDGIVHCAGAEIVMPLRLTGDGQYRTAMMAADSAFAILRAAATKGVMVDGGSIVLMSSVAAHRGTAGMVAYSAGKAAIEGMTRAAAVELAPRRIRVNAIAAGAFASPMHERVTSRMPKSAVDDYARAHPLGFGSVEAVRDAVLHLLSPASAWQTGSVVVVDGGYLAR